MKKDFEKVLYEALAGIAAEADLTDAPVDLRARQAVVRFNIEHRKANDLIEGGLTDAQHERLRAFYERAANTLKALCEEIESGKEAPKTESKKEEKPKFYVGQRVKFKTWKELSEEFEIDEEGDIDVGDRYFVKDMRPLCDTLATIKEITGNEVWLRDFSNPQSRPWHYSLSMIKPAE